MKFFTRFRQARLRRARLRAQQALDRHMTRLRDEDPEQFLKIQALNNHIKALRPDDDTEITP